VVSLSNHLQQPFDKLMVNGLCLSNCFTAPYRTLLRDAWMTVAQNEALDIDAEELTDSQIAVVLRNYATMPLGMKGDDDFRISIAGAQLVRTSLFQYSALSHTSDRCKMFLEDSCCNTSNGRR
jgi:hypothetical protein